MNNDAILNSTYFISYNNTYIINGSNIEFNISYKDIYNNDSITSTYYNNIEIFGHLYTYSTGNKVENNNVASSLEDNIDINIRDEYGCYANVAYELYNKIEETYKSYIEGNSLYDAIILNSYSYSYFSNYKDAKDNHDLKWVSYNNEKPSKVNITYAVNNLFNLYGNTYQFVYNPYMIGDYITNNYANTKIGNVNLSLENINVSYSNNINVDNDENILYIDKLNIKNCLSKPLYKASLHKNYYSYQNDSYPKELKNIFGNDIEVISNNDYNRIYSVEGVSYIINNINNNFSHVFSISYNYFYTSSDSNPSVVFENVKEKIIHLYNYTAYNYSYNNIRQAVFSNWYFNAGVNKLKFEDTSSSVAILAAALYNKTTFEIISSDIHIGICGKDSNNNIYTLYSPTSGNYGLCFWIDDRGLGKGVFSDGNVEVCVYQDAHFDSSMIKDNAIIISYINSSSRINTIGMELYAGNILLDSIYKKGYCQGSDNNSYYSLSIPKYYYIYNKFNIKYLCEDISGELNTNNSTLYIGIVNYDDDKYNKDIKNKKYQLLSNELNRLDKDKTKITINISNDISYSYISDSFLKYKYKYSNLLFDELSPNYFNIFNYNYIRNKWCATIPDYNSNFLYNNGYMCMSYNSTKLSYNNISLGLNKMLYPVINTNNIVRDIAYINSISNDKACSICQINDYNNIDIYTIYKITYTNNNITSNHYGNSPIIYLNYRDNDILLYNGSKDLTDFPITINPLINLRNYYKDYTQNSSYSNIFGIDYIFNDDIYKKDTHNLPLVKFNNDAFIYGILVNNINKSRINYIDNEHFQYKDVLSFNENPIKYNIVKGDLENIISKEIIISSPYRFTFSVNDAIDQNLCSYIINNDKYLYDESLIKLDYCDDQTAYTNLYPTAECYNNYHLLYYTLENNIKKYILLNIITKPFRSDNNMTISNGQTYLTLTNTNKKSVTIYNRNYPLTIYNNIENDKKTLYIYICSLQKDIWLADKYIINNVYYFYSKDINNLYIHLHEEDLQYIDNVTNIINNSISDSNKFESAIIISDKTLEEADYNLDNVRIIYYKY